MVEVGKFYMSEDRIANCYYEVLSGDYRATYVNSVIIYNHCDSVHLHKDSEFPISEMEKVTEISEIEYEEKLNEVKQLIEEL